MLLDIKQTPILLGTAEVYPLRLKLRPLTIFAHPLPLASVAGDLETFAGSADWVADLRETVMRAIPDTDCTRLIAATGRS